MADFRGSSAPVRPATTIGFLPRESFSTARRGLEALLASLGPGARVVCVDGGSPPPVRRYFERVARERDLVLLRTDRFLFPNEARNAVLPFVNTDFVAFVDYDTEVTPGWLERLEECARCTGATVTAPMFFERLGSRTRVHMAGAMNHVLELGDRRWLHETSIRELPRSPQAYQTENVDFHCVLVRRDVLEALGPFDEKIVSLRDHADLCLAVRDGGGTIYVEPSAEATYAPPHRFGRADRAFWLVRWSDAANKASLERFQTKWHLSDDDPSVDTNLVWGRSHRQYCYRPWTSIAQRLSGRLATRLVDRLDPFIERVAVARAAGRGSKAGAPRLIHRASWIASVESDVCL